MKEFHVVIISGPSGAGKSTALRILEDLGFFCIDNLPVTLLPKLLVICQQTSGDIYKVALVVDVREREFLKDFPDVFEEVKKGGYRIEVIYLESSDKILLRRFKETRRRHPLSEEDSPQAAITIERERLAGLKAVADKIIDTSSCNIHELKEIVKSLFSVHGEEEMVINIVSFSYRHGIPADADLVFDVRFLPNPFFVKELKEMDGNDDRVMAYVLNSEETRSFNSEVIKFLCFLLPYYKKEGKVYLTIAIGCTGGRHRSVSIVNFLATKLGGEGVRVNTRHREI